MHVLLLSQYYIHLLIVKPTASLSQYYMFTVKPSQYLFTESCCAKGGTWSALFIQQIQKTEEQPESLTEDLKAICSNLAATNTNTQLLNDITKEPTARNWHREAETFTHMWRHRKVEMSCVPQHE